MAEVAPGGPNAVNRNFLVIVGGLAALLVLGLVGFGLVLFWPGIGGSKQQVSAQTSFTATPVRIAPSPTMTNVPATATPVLLAAVLTSTPTATATARPTNSPTATSAATETVAPPSPTSQAQPTADPGTTGTMPTTGIGDSLWPLAAGIGLAILIFAVRRVRTADL